MPAGSIARLFARLSTPALAAPLCAMRGSPLCVTIVTDTMDPPGVGGTRSEVGDLADACSCARGTQWLGVVARSLSPVRSVQQPPRAAWCALRA